jgi:dTDP-4-amino-4,6-dideoxygalactose transaminase
MQAIHHLGEKYGFKIIEDASHAIGGKYKGAPIGNCRYSNIAVFSFHPVKIITTGEGGMAVTNDEKLSQKMALLRSHGITRDPDQMTKIPDGPWYYQQIALGFNYRMTDMQSVLGLSQAKRLDDFVSRRTELAHRYDRLLSGTPLAIPYQHPLAASAWHLYVVRLQLGMVETTHHNVFEIMRQNGIGVNLHYIPVHTQPWYRGLGFTAEMYPEAENYYREAISLPLFPSMTEQAQDRVVKILKDALLK